jgi:hypothetical protein
MQVAGRASEVESEQERKAKMSCHEHYCPNCDNSFRDQDELVRKLVAALTVAETFVSDELETRRSSFLPNPSEDESGYLGQADSTLKAIEGALAVSGSLK